MKKYLTGFFAIACLIVLAFTYGEAFIIKGKVFDVQGNPVVGATVIVKGTNKATSTDTTGSFSIEVTDLKSKLIISSVGYEASEIAIKDKGGIVVMLKPMTNMAQDVVVGYGSSKMANLDASRMTYRPEILATAPSGLTKQEDESYFGKIYKEKVPGYNREGYERIVENKFLKATDNPLSTFSIDVDAASYSNVRRMLNYNQLPPVGAVRIEEFINYFTYEYPQPQGEDPFTINTEIAKCPWNEEHRLVSIGLQGKKVPVGNLPPSNLTFLIDVSGSMAYEDKLPLVKASLKLLTEQLRENDKVSIVVYAGNAGLVLPPTSGADKGIIKQAIERLEAGGSTAGGMGIQLAYKIAGNNFIKNGNNRVILCTDGDFNVGLSSDDELERLIEKERESGIFLTVLGYGMGNYQDAKMQKLADKGNGNHAYIDNMTEAKKVLVNEFGGTLFAIAKDVKLQVEFNPAKVQGYRLIGYENRMLAKEDFNNDKKDAGELGSGHTVTALYEVIPVGVKTDKFNSVDDLKYQKPVKQQVETAFNGEIINIKLRYKQPDGKVSKLLQHPVLDRENAISLATNNLKFAAAVAQFGMLLRDSDYKGSSSYKNTEQLAASALGNDGEGYKKEFIELVRKAQELKKEYASNE